ncbi:unnamed protein product [Closterium sp. NIES-64]|nr:unnamed protein product [Closterium sp. NIES-64]
MRYPLMPKPLTNGTCLQDVPTGEMPRGVLLAVDRSLVQHDACRCANRTCQRDVPTGEMSRGVLLAVHRSLDAPMGEMLHSVLLAVDCWLVQRISPAHASPMASICQHLLGV